MTTYRLVDDRDGSPVIETGSKRLFSDVIQERLDHDAGGFVLPRHYTITVTETASGDEASSLAWGLVR